MPRRPNSEHTALRYSRMRQLQAVPEMVESQPERLWLDLLPHELRARIAAYVSEGGHTGSALQLAETNMMQREAIIEAFSYSIDALSIAISDPARWTSVFKTDLRQVTFGMPAAPFLSFRVQPYLRQLLNAPTLRRAEIPDHNGFLTAISGSPSVRELTVFMFASFMYPSPVLMETLKTLDLTRLELCCRLPSPFECPLNDASKWKPAPEALADSCPRLRRLKTSCWQNHLPSAHPPWQFLPSLPRDPLWEVLPKFRCLREVTLEREAPEEIHPLLMSLPSVQIIRAPNGLRMAKRISASVTCLVTEETLTPADIESLTSCPHLTELAIGVREGAESSLVAAVGAMASLRSLKLSWGRPAGGIEPSHRWTSARYCAAKAGAILDVVGSAPKLVEVELYFVSIGGSELEQILKCVGIQLEKFAASIANQEEAPFDRLERISQALIAYNPRLSSFRVDGGAIDYTSPDNVEARTRQRMRLFASMRLLKRRNPMVDVTEPVEYIARASFMPSPSL